MSVEEVDAALLPIELLNCSPSQREGVNGDSEVLHRTLGCEFVQEACILMRLPQVVSATGQNILHRFFYRYSYCATLCIF